MTDRTPPPEPGAPARPPWQDWQDPTPQVVEFGPGARAPRPLVLTPDRPRGTFLYVPARPGPDPA